MYKSVKKIAILILISALLTFPNNLSLAKDGKVEVVTTLPYLTSIVKAIGGDFVKVECLVPQGSDPHHYELTINDVQKIENANLIVMTGPSHTPVELKIQDMVSKKAIKGIVVNYEDYVKNGLNLIKLPDGKYNPHGYFLSYNGLRAIAISVADALKKVDSKNSKLYDFTLNLYLSSIDKLSEMAKSGLKGRNIKVSLFTPILQYALHDLGIKIVNILVIEQGVEPTVRAVENLINLAKRREIDFVLLTDMDEGSYKSIVKLFNDENIPYIIVPFLKAKITERPESISIIITSSILSYTQQKTQKDIQLNLSMPLTISITANIILSLLVISLYLKIRRL
jgi:ABC-type Zn uptake system ZnuABC Zn-binding protein ZnuA